MNWQAVTERIERATGREFTLAAAQPLSGGDISSAYRLQGRDRSYFIKLNRRELGQVDGSVERRDGIQPSAVLIVADGGPGIPLPERERVFDRFHRVPGTASPGSGIGLALVRSIAEHHHALVRLGEGPDGRGLQVNVEFSALDPS